MLIDDLRFFLDGLRADLDRFPQEIEVVGTALNAEDGLSLIEALLPDVAVIGLQLPRTHRASDSPNIQSGLWLAKQIRLLSGRGLKQTRVLVLSMSVQALYVLYSALQAGVDGCIAKSEPLMGRDLVTKIQEISRGEFQPHPFIAEQIRKIATLTPRELQVLELLIQAKTDAEIQQALRISPGDVIGQVAGIRLKLAITRQGNSE